MEPFSPTASPSKLPDSERVPGYRLEKLIGKGGMGEVYQAIQLSLGRTVAVKLLSPEFAREESFVARFEKEAAALASLSHPNVVSIVDKGTNKGTSYLVMEYVGGPSLRDVICERKLCWVDALCLVNDIARAVHYAHERGVIHRDLKPENILFDTQAGFIPKVTDFGLAGFVKGEAERRFAMTETHVSMGTAAYMAPEQQINAKGVDGRADLYSLGIMLYEMLVGDVPRGNFDPPSVLIPGVDKRLDAVVARCLKASPQDRYSSVADFLTQLQPFVPNITRSAPARRLTRWERLRQGTAQAARVGLRIAFAAVLAAALLVLIVAGSRSRWPVRASWLRAKAAIAELPPAGIVTAFGRIENSLDRRVLSLGEGDEKIPLLAVGRPAALKGDTLLFAGPPSRSPGRATPQMADLVGESALVSAVLTPPARAPMRLFSALRSAILGEEIEPRSAVILEGASGRYAAVVVFGTPARTALEWSFGKEREGVLWGPALREPSLVELRVDRDGDLHAFLGEGKARKPIGEAIWLEAGWKAAFGESPHPAVACIDAVCEIRKLRFEVQRAPSEQSSLFADSDHGPRDAHSDAKDPRSRDSHSKDPKRVEARKLERTIEAHRLADSKKSDLKKSDSKKSETAHKAPAAPKSKH